jgi:hypothetical protein
MMGQRVLMVEGKDDEKVVEHLLKVRGMPQTFKIVQPRGQGHYGDAGIEQLLDQVALTLKGESETERLALVLDADTNIDARWAQLRDRLRRGGFGGIPEMPEEAGTIVDFDLETRTVKFGVWIMPNNKFPGMLEDFLAWLVPNEDKMLSHVDAFLRRIPTEDRLFQETHFAKARIHSYLAVQREPGKPLGLAITCRYLDPDKDAIVSPFLDWLRSILID